MADLIVVAVLIAAVAWAIRTLRRDGVSCGGDCGSCVGGCATPRIELTEEQERHLRELRRIAEENGQAS